MTIIGRLALPALLAILAGHQVDAFSSSFLSTRTPSLSLAATEASESVDLDVSIPYDAAARLSYDEWRKTYNKGDFDEKRYQVFKENYEEITVANVKAKKEARESGEESPKLLALNEFGDCTADEYQKAQQSGTGDVLGKALKAAESQSVASAALGDAAEALAEEEEKLAAKLGYDSVEELEVAMDKMEGIAEDGGELPDNLAREARVRSAYLDWCKKYEKEPDETRFPTFSANFLAMEQYAKEAGKEMSLNRYADCTEEEYSAAVAAEAADREKKAAEEAEKKAQAEAKAAEELRAKEEAKKKAAEEARAKAEALAKMSPEERKQAAEKERRERQAEQEKAAEKLRQENEAAAIAAVKAAAEKEAAQTAKRKAIDEEASEFYRKQAVAAEERQRKLIESRLSKQAQKRKKEPLSVIASFMEPKDDDMKAAADEKLKQIKAAGEAAKEAKKAAYARSASANKAKKPSAGLDFSSFFQPPKKKTTPKKKPAPEPAPKSKPATKTAAKSTPIASFFAPPKPAKKETTTSAKAVPAPKPKAKKEPFSFFGKATAPARTPAPAPAPKPVAKKEPFSFFGKPPAPAPAPAPAPKPVAKKEPFSFFGKPPAPAPVPAPKPVAKKEPFSFFGNAPSPRPKPQQAPKAKGKKTAPAPVQAKKPAKPFSFFGSSPAPKKQPVSKPAAKVAKSPAPKKQPFSFFGGSPSPVKSPAPAKKAVAPAKKAGRGTLTIPRPKDEGEAKKGGWTLFGVGSTQTAKPKDDIPVLSRFVQNADGSITGFVSNSKGFRNGTKITTSPVRKGAKAGQIVRTASGSRYRLQ